MQLKMKLRAQKNLFVSFTQLDKLGINTSSDYDTPLGIYAYPVEYVIETAGNNPMSTLPFAGDAPFANIFNVTGNIINIEELNDLKKQCSILKELFPNFKNFIEKARLESESKVKKELITYDFAKFWYITNRLAKFLTTQNGYSKKMTVNWRTIFQKMKIDGIVDLKYSAFHVGYEGEPTQAVFFSIKSIKNNERIYNKYSPVSGFLRQMQGNTNDKLARRKLHRYRPPLFNKDLTWEEFQSTFQFRNVKERLKLLGIWPELIEWLPRPTALEQKLMLEISNDVIRLIGDERIKPDVIAKYMTTELANKLIPMQGRFTGNYTDEDFIFTNNKIVNAIIKVNPSNFFKLINPTRPNAFTAIQMGADEEKVKEYYNLRRK